MPGFLVLLFWLWLAGSVVVYAYRFFTKGSLRSANADEATESEERYAAFEAQLAAMPAPAAPVTTDAPQRSPSGSKDAIEAASERTVEAEPRPAPSQPAPIDGARAMTLAEALDGIEMPADLIPLTTDRFNPRQMQFVTDVFPAAEVGASLADELERLGFAIAPVDNTTVRAEQARAGVEVRILPDRPAISAALGERAATLPPEAVVVEFQLA